MQTAHAAAAWMASTGPPMAAGMGARLEQDHSHTEDASVVPDWFQNGRAAYLWGWWLDAAAPVFLWVFVSTLPTAATLGLSALGAADSAASLVASTALAAGQLV